MSGHLGSRGWEGEVHSHSPGKFPMQTPSTFIAQQNISRHKCTHFRNNNKHTFSRQPAPLNSTHNDSQLTLFTKALSVWYTEMGIQNSDWSSRSQGFPDMLLLCLKQVLLGKHWPRFSSTFTQIYQWTRTLGSFVKELQIIFAPLVLTACNMALGAEHDTSGILNPLSCFNTVHWMTEAFVECFRGILLPPPQKACTCMHLEICSAESYPFIRFYLLNMSESLSTSIRRTCVWHCVTLHSCKLVQRSIYSVQWLTSDAGLILFYLWWEKLDSEKNGSV